MDCIKEFLKTGATKSEKRFKHKDGSVRWWEVNAVRLNENISLALARDITDRRAQEQLAKNHLLEKEVILKEVHHRMKNNMLLIRSLLSLQKAEITDPKAISALNDTLSRIDSMALLYEKLYSTSDYLNSSLSGYISILVDHIISTFPNNDRITIIKEIEEISVQSKHLQNLGIILNEILTNIMKYAFIGREKGTVSIIGSENNRRITISVNDNGIGLPEHVNFENTPGFGLTLIHELTRQLDGTIKIERENGTRVILEFAK